VADQPGPFEHADETARDRESRSRGTGTAHGQDRSAARTASPAEATAERLSALIELVKRDPNGEWQQGRSENLETYLKSLAEIEGSATLSAELILAEYELRCRSGESPGGPPGGDLSTHPSGLERRPIEPQTSEPAPDSILGRLSEMAARARNRPGSRGPAKPVTRLPRQFGRYRLLEELGQGAMGTVYLARDTQLHRQVALKIPLARSVNGDDTHHRRVLDRFYHEAHAAAILRHPNLCPVYDVGEIDGVPYLTMAYVKGRPLSRFINRNRPLSLRWVGVLVRKLALALQAAHDKGVVHRDLKPSNVMICGGREPMIMDFGLAWRVDRRDAEERLTRTGMVLGTPAYMSPEQLSGRVEDLGPRCDVYSLGVILYELLTGRCPFEGPEAVVLAQVLFVEPERPSIQRPDLDPRLETICLKAMAKRDAERHASMSELAADLGVYLRRDTRSQPRPPSDVGSDVAPDLSAATDAGPDEPASSGEPEAFDAAPEPETYMAVPSWDGLLKSQVHGISDVVLPPAGLLKSWREFTETVASFALGRKSRRARDPDAFTALRTRLLATLRARSSQTQEPDAGFYLAMEQLVTPWVSVYSMAREDREILADLLQRCQQVEWILDYRSTEKRTSGWFAAVSIVVAVAFAALLWQLLFK
jgi:serine/threonine protein kinase